ncbi:MAG: hypothetical protein N3F66_12735 [Spirochaetes bacterium]|nr:hypothetical protein [Spirochaetota bacterium]
MSPDTSLEQGSYYAAKTYTLHFLPGVVYTMAGKPKLMCKGV